MRSEAALTGVPNVENSAVPGHLSNPLIETAAVQGDLRAAPRFDFYTDPMAAFSDNRKRGKVDDQDGGQHYAAPPNASGWPRVQHPQSFPVLRNYEMNPCPPAYQMQNNYSQENRVFPAQSPYRSPSPLPTHQGPPGARNEYRARANYSNYAPDGSGFARPPFNYPGHPRPWHGAMDAGGYSSPPNPPIDANLPSPYPLPPGPPDFSHGPPMSRFGNNPMPSPVYRGSNPGSGFGRGRCRSYTGAGRGGRQGPGYHRPNMASDRAPEPERFFNASMLQDPWQQMEPVVWRKQDTKMTNPSSSSSWLPQSIREKKERAPETFNQASSQPSLAEYLAASFNKAAEDSATESGS